jgi:predicted nucleic acid-binding protein
VDALVIDTSSWIAHLRASAGSRVDEALSRVRVYLPPIVLAELLSGRMSRRERARLLTILDPLALCRTDRGHWTRVGELRARLAGLGLSASLPDVHVAQCALDLDAPLLTEDGVFGLIAKRTRLRLAARAG